MTDENERFPKLTLANFGGGLLEEVVAEEAAKVWANIKDINRDRTAKRSITIELTFEPSEADASCATGWKVSSKLAPMVGAAGVVYVVERGGENVAVLGEDVKQMELRWREEAKPKALRPEPAVEAAGQ